jgi:hypothetical protein
MTEQAFDIEALAERVHQAYLDTCKELGWSVKPENQVAYVDLTEASKELDRASVRAVLTAALEEAQRSLGNLLAIIHRDGGHYQAEHGTTKAVEDAHLIWAELMTAAEEAQRERDEYSYQASLASNIPDLQRQLENANATALDWCAQLVVVKGQLEAAQAANEVMGEFLAMARQGESNLRETLRLAEAKAGLADAVAEWLRKQDVPANEGWLARYDALLTLQDGKAVSMKQEEA